MLPLLRDTTPPYSIHSVNITLRRNLDHRVSSALIPFFTRRLRRPTTHLLRPLSQSLVPWLQRKNKAMYPLALLYPRQTRLFLFLKIQSESVCITVLGPAVQKATVPSITSMFISSCNGTGANEPRQVRFTLIFATKTAPSNLRQSGQNLRSSGSKGAKLRKMNQNVSRCLNGQRSASICAQSRQPYIPPKPTCGSLELCLLKDSNFLVQGCPSLQWANSLLVVKRCR